MPKPAPDRYTSDLSQFCAEYLPDDFHFLDGDEVLLRYPGQPILYCRETRVLRIVESKGPGEELRRSQRDVFPLLADIIDRAVHEKQVAQGSGVFVVQGTFPFKSGATVSKIRPGGTRSVGIQYEATHPLMFDQLSSFIRCRPLGQQKAAA